MQDESKTKEQLVDELNDMRLRMSEFKNSQAKLVANEMALRESEERFRLLYQNAPLGCHSLDENGRFLEVNKAWLNILGYSREEVIGKWFGDFLAPDHQAQFKVDFGWIEAAGDNHTEFEMVKRDGSRITVALDRKIGHGQDGRFKQTYCILRNVTKHKLADEALKRSEEMLKSSLAASPLGITLSAPDRKIVWANDAAYMMFGFSEQKQMTGRLINRASLKID